MEEYQSFRRRTMYELTREFPEISYREKMKIVGERWKQTKITQLVKMNFRELLEDPITDQYLKRLKYTIIDAGPEEFMNIELPRESVKEDGGRNLLMTVMSRVFRTAPANSPIIFAFQKFFTLKDFYRKKIYELDIFDLCCLHFRHDVMFLILDLMPPRWRREIILERGDRLPFVMNVYLYNVLEEDSKAGTIDTLRQLLLGGLDPNLELASPLSETSPLYEDSLTRIAREKEIPLRGLEKLVRYTGLPNEEFQKYREFLKGSEYARSLDTFILEEDRSRKLVGDTVFSILLQNSRSQRLRGFVSGIIRSGAIYTNAVLHPYRYRDMEGVKTYLTISLLTGSLKHMDELSSLLFEKTPAYAFYISDLSQKIPTGNANPLTLALKNIKTCWNGFLRTSPDSVPVISKILTGGFCIPREEFFWKIHMQPAFVSYVREELVKIYFQRSSKTIFENLLEACETRGIDPLETCLSALLLYPPVLKRVLEEGVEVMQNQGYVLRQFQAYRKTILEEISRLCLPNNPDVDYVNETFLLGDEPVRGSPKLIFRTEDNYAFEPSDWPFLLAKKMNPYTRRELTDEEKGRLRSLRECVNRHWVLLSRDDIPHLSFLDRKEEVSLRDIYVRKIDEFLDSIDMVNYGIRLRDQIEKLENPAVLKNFYTFLFHNPGMCSFGPETDTTFADWCVSLSHSSIDPGDLEEISIYFAFRIKDFGEDSIRKTQTEVLGHIYNVLETTLEYGRKDRFIGRVLSIYYLIDNYLRNV